jgi:hypothetical protein
MIRNPRIIYRNTYLQLNTLSSAYLRNELYLMQGRCCPVLKRKFLLSSMAMDHKHKLKAQEPGPDGLGLIRGLTHDQVNSFEGMAYKKYKRQGLHKFIKFPDLLIALGHYLKNPTCPPLYIHMSEKPKAARFGKREYNLICKYYPIIHPRSRVIPPFPKSGIKWKGKGKNRKQKYSAKLTNKWIQLIEEAQAYHGRKK